MEDPGGANQVRHYGVVRPLESGPEIRVFLLEEGPSTDASERVLTLVPAEYQQGEAGRRAVERLYNLRARTSHPLLPEIQGIGFRGRLAGFVTAHFKEEKLYETGPNWPLERRLEAAQDLLLLFSFLHRRSIQAGWLSPAKIFCRDDRLATINLVLPAVALAGSPPSVRSLRYCAPEILDGGEPGTASDAYALGMLLYFLFTGCEPFSDSSPDSIRRKQMAVNPTPVRILRDELPPVCQVLVDGLIRKRPQDRFSVDQALQMLSENLSRANWQAPGLATPLVGRKKELEQLREALKRFARRRRPWISVVSGPAGIGKTFLTEQLLVGAHLRQMEVLGIAHRETDGAFEAFRHGLETHPSLNSGHPSHEIAHQGRRLATHIVALAHQKPLLIRATDLQWLDEGSLEIYRHVLGGEAPVMLLGDVRNDQPNRYWTELEAEFRRSGRLGEIALPPLSAVEIQEILEHAIGSGWPDGWLQQVTGICSGNPFHLKALLSCLRDRNQIRYTGLGWTGRRLFEAEWAPPQTVSEGLRARIERVHRTGRTILDCLTLLDRPAELDLLSRVIQRDPQEVLDQLRCLEALGFLEITGDFACPLAALSHRWLKAILEQELPPDARNQIHRRILGALTQSSARHSRPGPEELARHSIASDSKQEAEFWTRIAVSELRQDRLFRQASDLFERALAAGCLSSACWEDVKTRIELLYLAGDHPRCEHVIQEQLAGHCSRSHLPHLWTMLARILIVRGRLYDAGRLLEQAHSASEDDEPAFLETAAELVTCLSHTGELAKARQPAARLLRHGRPSQTPEVVGKIFGALSRFFRSSGRHGEAVSWLVRSVRAAVRLGDPVAMARRCLELGTLQFARGELGTAERMTFFGSEIAARTGNLQLRMLAALNRAQLANAAGQHTTAERLLREFARPSQQGRHPDLDTHIQAQLATSSLERLRISQANRFVETGRGFALAAGREAAREIAFVEARLKLMTGGFQEVLETAGRLSRSEDPLWQARGCLLGCRADRALGIPHAAGRRLAPAVRQSFRTGLLLRAEILVENGRIELACSRPEAALLYGKAALKTLQNLDSPILLAESYALLAHASGAIEAPVRARVFGNRALQVLARCERPLLRSHVLASIADAEVALGRPADAEKHYSAALESLCAPCELFAPELRAAFTMIHIEPIEKRMERSLRRRRTPAPLRLVGLTRFTTAVTGRRDPSGLARHLLRCLRDQLGITAGSLFWTTADGEIGSAAAATGQHRFDARRMIMAATADRSAEIRPRILEGTLALVMPLDDAHGTAGWLYAEKVGVLPEVEFDLLGTLRAITQLALSLAPPRRRKAELPAQIRLRNGRVLAGRHPQVRQMIQDAQKFAATESTVLVCGESGTGKELIARAIHEFSRRRNGPFVAVNCASFAAELIESQLFGHARGAFTGATYTKIGFFEAASGGTLFLDEISSMPSTLQPRLLRVLQEKQIIRLGETEQRPVDTRVLAATNCDLKGLCERGAFRSDLFHRLNVLRVDVPPLRDRRSDIPVLTRYFLEEFCSESGLNVRITTAAMQALTDYPFPGNVRELRNLLENLSHTCKDAVITPSDIEARIAPSRNVHSRRNDRADLEQIVEDMAEGRATFWSAVRQPFLERILSKRDVIYIVSMGLDACGGNYRRLVRYFGLEDSEYKKFLNFLSHHGCKVDFRRFRRQTD